MSYLVGWYTVLITACFVVQVAWTLRANRLRQEAERELDELFRKYDEGKEKKRASFKKHVVEACEDAKKNGLVP